LFVITLPPLPIIQSICNPFADLEFSKPYAVARRQELQADTPFAQPALRIFAQTGGRHYAISAVFSFTSEESRVIGHAFGDATTEAAPSLFPFSRISRPNSFR
jgi:hypothetical protein